MTDKLHGDIKAGKTDVSIPVLLRLAADGTEKTGVAHGDVTAYYTRQGAAAVSITMASLGSANASHSDGGWFEYSSTNQPGLFRFDAPDAAFAAGADWVVVTVKVAGCFVFVERFALESRGSAELYTVMTGVTIQGSVNDASATTTSFVGDSSLSSSDSAYVNQFLVPTSGTMAGIPRKITAYNGTTKAITVGTAWPAALANGTTFEILGLVAS